jgi:hypothetical protein
MAWSEIVGSSDYRGRWVALDNVRFDPMTAEPLEAEVVDVDDDLAELCARMRDSDRTSCQVRFCTDAHVVRMRRPTPVPRATAAR